MPHLLTDEEVGIVSRPLTDEEVGIGAPQRPLSDEEVGIAPQAPLRLGEGGRALTQEETTALENKPQPAELGLGQKVAASIKAASEDPFVAFSTSVATILTKLNIMSETDANKLGRDIRTSLESLGPLGLEFAGGVATRPRAVIRPLGAARDPKTVPSRAAVGGVDVPEDPSLTRRIQALDPAAAAAPPIPSAGLPPRAPVPAGISKEFTQEVSLPARSLKAEQAAREQAEFQRAIDAGGPMSQEALDALQAERAPGAPDKAGNINLDRIFAPEDVKAVIRDTAAANAEFTGARRGTITQDQTHDMGQLLGMTDKQLAKRLEGQAFNAEQIDAARELLIAQAARFKQAAIDARGGNDLQRAKAAEEMTRLVAIQEQVHGITAEAGRALQIFRRLAGGDADEIARLAEMAKTGRIDDIIDMVATMDADQVSAFTAKAFRAKTSDMLLEIWINGLLSGPTTQAVNILSNSLVAAWSVPEAAVAAGIGVGRAAVAAGRGASREAAFKLGRGPNMPERVFFGEVGERAFGFVEGIKDGLIAAVRTFRTEEPTITQAGKIEARRFKALPSVTLRKGAKPKQIAGVDVPFTGELQLGGKQIRTPGRLLMAGDEIFKAIGYRQKINQLALRAARREGLRGGALATRVAELKGNPTDSMMKAGRAAADKQTFTNTLGEDGRAFQAWVGKHAMAKIPFPFVRTSINIFKFSIERSIFAPLFKEVRSDLMGLNGAVARDEAIAKIALGSAVSSLAAWAAVEGHVTGQGPVNNPREAALKRKLGWQPNSVRIGGEYYNISRMEPLGTLINVAADMVELSQAMRKGELENVAVLILGSAARNVTSKTFMKGMTDMIEAYTDPVRYGPRYVQSLVGTLIPTGVAQLARNQDPFLREARTILDKVKARIPGARQTLKKRRDIFGEAIKTEGALGPDIISPIFKSVAKDDPAIAEMLRLKVAPDLPSRKINDVELEPDEYEALQIITGSLVRKGLTELVAGPKWKVIPDQIKSEIILGLFETARDVGRIATQKRFPNLVARIEQAKEDLEDEMIGQLPSIMQGPARARVQQLRDQQ